MAGDAGPVQDLGLGDHAPADDRSRPSSPILSAGSRLFPDLGSWPAPPSSKVLRAWQGLGYYQRARNLHRAARTVVREHGGKVPDEESILRSLPGFGPYTTAAVLSLAYGRPLPVIDANVRRVLMRMLGTPRPGLIRRR